MAVTINHLTTSSSSTDGGPWNTASVTPTASRLYLCSTVVSGTSPAPTIASVSGWGLTWLQVATSTGSGTRNTQIFGAIGTPSAGSLTITVGTGNTGTACGWSVVEVAGADISGTVANAIVQSISARVTTQNLSQAYTNTVGAANATFAAISSGGSAEVLTPVSPWSLVGGATFASPTGGITSQFCSTAQQNIQASAGSSIAMVPTGIEIKAAASTNLDKLKLGTNLVGLRVGTNTPSKIYLGSTQVWP